MDWLGRDGTRIKRKLQSFEYAHAYLERGEHLDELGDLLGAQSRAGLRERRRASDSACEIRLYQLQHVLTQEHDAFAQLFNAGAVLLARARGQLVRSQRVERALHQLLDVHQQVLELQEAIGVGGGSAERDARRAVRHGHLEKTERSIRDREPVAARALGETLARAVQCLERVQVWCAQKAAHARHIALLSGRLPDLLVQIYCTHESVRNLGSQQS